MKKLIINALLLAGGVMVLILIGSVVGPASQNAAPVLDLGNSPLIVQEQSYDFGTISMAAGKVMRQFTVTNPTDQPVTVSKIFTSCMCTSAAILNGESRQGPFGMPGHASISSISETIQPGGQAVIEVVYDPAAHGPAGVGRFERVVTVETDAATALRLGIRGFVTP